jgi:ribulose bisphosphate carboxylase small subunit
MGKRFGLGRDAIFRLWKADKDDERLLDEAIKETYERMVGADPVHAEEVMSLIIRRNGAAKQAFIDILARVKGQALPAAPASASQWLT